jgi:1-deoxy-D-xylulose-5-phosphate synthase
LIKRTATPVALGRADVYRWGMDGTLIAFGTLFSRCVDAATSLKAAGLDIGVVNARFLRPLDTDTIFRAIEETGFVITVEEGTLNGGFGSAVLEAANTAQLPTDRIRRLGIPDRFIEHGSRSELLTDLGLDVTGLISAAKAMVEFPSLVNQP